MNRLQSFGYAGGLPRDLERTGTVKGDGVEADDVRPSPLYGRRH